MNGAHQVQPTGVLVELVSVELVAPPAATDRKEYVKVVGALLLAWPGRALRALLATPV
jgi:hypothetical protein